MRKTRIGKLLAAALVTAALAAFGTTAWAEGPDYSWYVNHKDGVEYTLSNVDELLGFANIVNGTAGNDIGTSTFDGKTVKLGADINLKGVEWTPIGKNADNEKEKFFGTFDGDNHTISNLSLNTEKTTEYMATGFFGCLGGTAENIIFDNAEIKGYSISKATSNGIAVVAGSLYTAKENSQGVRLAPEIKNVTVRNSEISGNRYVSAVTGYSYGNVSGCTVANVKITAEPDGSKGNFDNGDKVGGVVGYACATTKQNLSISNNTVDTVEIKAFRDLGGVVGASYTNVNGTGNTVRNLTLICDRKTNHYPESGDEKAVNVGLVTGRVDGGTISGTTANATKFYVNDSYSLAAAIGAAKDGDTITLRDNVTLTATQEINKNMTIDLNGHTITGSLCRVFQVKSGTLSLTGNGKVESVSTAQNTLDPSKSVIRVGEGDEGTKQFNQTGNTVAKLTIGKDVVIEAPGSYGVTVFGSNTKETVEISGTIKAGKSAALSGNGSTAYGGTTINIHDGAYLYSEKDNAIYHPQSGNLVIGSCTIEGQGGIEVKSGSTTIEVKDAPTIIAHANPSHTPNGNGTSTKGYSIVIAENNSYAGNSTVTIENGFYTGPVAIVQDSDPVTPGHDGHIYIRGGYFTDNPKDYLGNDSSNTYAALPSDIQGYTYVVKKSNTSSVAVPDTGNTDAKPAENPNDTDKFTNSAAATEAENAANGITAEGLEAYAGQVANEVTTTQQQAINELTNGNVSDATADNTKILALSYLNVTPKELKTEGQGTETTATYTVDIKPVVQVVATTADKGTNVVTSATEQSQVNAVVLQTVENIKVEVPITVKIPLPNTFVNAMQQTSENQSVEGRSVFVTHIKSTGEKYIYNCTVKKESSDEYYVEFVNTKGFSEFSVTITASTKASITRGTGASQSTMYFDTLQAAVDEVQNGETIKPVAQLVTGDVAYVSRSVNFTVLYNGQSGFAAGSIKEGSNTKITAKDVTDGIEFNCVYTAPTTPTTPNSGVAAGSDGKLHVYKDGKVDTGATGLYADAEGKETYYFVKGDLAQDGKYTGLVTDTNGKVASVKDSKVDTTLNGLICIDKGDHRLFENGWTDPTSAYKGLYKNTDGNYYYLEKSAVDFGYNGLVLDEKNNFRLVQDGVCYAASTYKGLAKHVDGWYYYIQDGKLNEQFNGLVTDENGDFRLVQNGVCNTTSPYEGLAKHSDGWSYYLKAGKIDMAYTGLVPDGDLNFWYVYKGCVNTTSTEAYAVQHSDGQWYAIQGGKWDKTFTGTLKDWNGAEHSFTGGTAA